MDKYNYYTEVANDIVCWMDKDGDPFDISQFENREDTAEYLYDILWHEDSVTGNGGCFYADEDMCEEFLCHNINLIIDACDDFYVDYPILRQQYKNKNLARFLDCTIRCYVLMTAIYSALEEWEGYGFKYKGENK